jgi:hypothetical protein
MRSNRQRNRSRLRSARRLPAEVIGLFEKIYRGLLAALKPDEAPVHRRLYTCRCGRPVYFQNSLCTACKAPLGYLPELSDVRALDPAANGTWRISGEESSATYRRCVNFDSPAGCNWLLSADDPTPACISCRLNRTVPDLADADNQRYWRAIESAKRRLVSQLLAMELPVKSKTEDPERGLAFDLLRAPAQGPGVLTGHAGGLITLNVEEADDARREQIRHQLHEPYRTLLGHFRHEVGHYYWDRLIPGTEWEEPFRALFGDERADYAAALKANYESGPPADWRNRYISAYASSHPWEAETWAHFMHIQDSLDTAMSFGLAGNQIVDEVEPYSKEDLYAPDDGDAERFLVLLNAWLGMTAALNELARSMGQPDFYPFVMSRSVVRKLHFIQLVCRQRPAAA